MSAARAALPLLALLALLTASPARAEKRPLVAGERIDLNTASAAELMRLPGVGKKRAEAIVAARDRRPFRRAEELTKVKGLSAGWFGQVRGMVTVGDAAPRPEPARPAPAAKGG